MQSAPNCYGFGAKKPSTSFNVKITKLTRDVILYKRVEGRKVKDCALPSACMFGDWLSDGRYESDGFKNTYNAIAQSNHDAIEIFAALAITNGIGWEAVLVAIGYEPLLEPSDAAKGWL